MTKGLVGIVFVYINWFILWDSSKEKIKNCGPRKKKKIYIYITADHELLLLQPTNAQLILVSRQ